MAGATGKIIAIVIALFVFSALASTVVQNLLAVNTTGGTYLTDIPELMGLIFLLGVGVILVAKELGILHI